MPVGVAVGSGVGVTVGMIVGVHVGVGVMVAVGVTVLVARNVANVVGAAVGVGATTSRPTLVQPKDAIISKKMAITVRRRDKSVVWEGVFTESEIVEAVWSSCAYLRL